MFNHSLLGRLARILKIRLSGGSQEKIDWEAFEKARSQAGGGAQNAAGAHEDKELAGYYANLEVPYGSDLESVRKAWKKLARKYHPDLHSSDPEKVKIANEILQGLNNAYEQLEKHLQQDDS